MSRPLTKKQQIALADYLADYKRVAAIEARMETQKPGLIRAVKARGGKIRVGSITVAVEEKNTYEYSEEVKALEKQLNALRKAERDSLVATCDSTKKLVVRATAK